MTEAPRFVRPREGGYGSQEFRSTLRRLRFSGQSSGAGPSGSTPPAHEFGPVELGVYESDADRGFVHVRLDSTRQMVQADFDGFMPGYQLEAGDELSVEIVDGGWRTMPEVRHTIKHPDRIEMWGINRITGKYRLLIENYYE